MLYAPAQLTRCRIWRCLPVLRVRRVQALGTAALDVELEAAANVGGLADIQAGVSQLLWPPVLILDIDGNASGAFEHDMPVGGEQLGFLPDPPERINPRRLR